MTDLTLGNRSRDQAGDTDLRVLCCDLVACGMQSSQSVHALSLLQLVELAAGETLGKQLSGTGRSATDWFERPR
jgi:hypothetical protein